MKTHPQRGDIYWVSLDPTIGSEIRKTRPAIIVSNDAANEVSRRVIVAPITSQATKIYPFEVSITLKDKEGKILLDQIRSIDKARLGSKIMRCSNETILLVNEALKIALSLT
jgi:mRNA interferase MazF